MRRLCLIVFAFFLSVRVYAQVADIGLETRMSLHTTGFNADRLSLFAKGGINSKWSYSFLQHMNKTIDPKDILNATDKLFIGYAPSARWNFQLGKMPLAIGSWEFDAAPIDVYYYSRLINNYDAFQLAASGQYNFRNGKDALQFQVARSPLSVLGQYNRFSYNLMWIGNHGPVHFLYSANAEQFDTGFRYLLCLGTSLTLGRFSAFVDLLGAHWSDYGGKLINTATFCTKLDWRILSNLSVFAKFTADRDRDLYNGVRFGGGAEFFPLNGSDDLRLHIQVNRENSNVNKGTVASIGIKWKIHFYRKYAEKQQ